mmetsp:Transcript_12513/g.32004  ORF Transcript_12513/g.32004 Transcript_12513/m.32004 type:complete len:313 (-) Transcript_12513:639-1577(-)
MKAPARVIELVCKVPHRPPTAARLVCCHHRRRKELVEGVWAVWTERHSAVLRPRTDRALSVAIRATFARRTRRHLMISGGARNARTLGAGRSALAHAVEPSHTVRDGHRPLTNHHVQATRRAQCARIIGGDARHAQMSDLRKTGGAKKPRDERDVAQCPCLVIVTIDDAPMELCEVGKASCMLPSAARRSESRIDDRAAGGVRTHVSPRVAERAHECLHSHGAATLTPRRQRLPRHLACKPSFVEETKLGDAPPVAIPLDDAAQHVLCDGLPMIWVGPRATVEGCPSPRARIRRLVRHAVVVESIGAARDSM